jgi:hypothetical protein
VFAAGNLNTKKEGKEKEKERKERGEKGKEKGKRLCFQVQGSKQHQSHALCECQLRRALHLS